MGHAHQTAVPQVSYEDECGRGWGDLGVRVVGL